jgi:hypothetical protein
MAARFDDLGVLDLAVDADQERDPGDAGPFVPDGFTGIDRFAAGLSFWSWWRACAAPSGAGETVCAETFNENAASVAANSAA